MGRRRRPGWPLKSVALLSPLLKPPFSQHHSKPWSKHKCAPTSQSSSHFFGKKANALANNKWNLQMTGNFHLNYDFTDITSILITFHSRLYWRSAINLLSRWVVLDKKQNRRLLPAVRLKLINLWSLFLLRGCVQPTWLLQSWTNGIERFQHSFSKLFVFGHKSTVF